MGVRGSGGSEGKMEEVKKIRGTDGEMGWVREYEGGKWERKG